MKDSLIQLAENGWLFVLDTEERNIFKVVYRRLKEVKTQSALISNKEWSKLAGVSIGTLIKYRSKLVSYGLLTQIRTGGSYVGDANAWGIPSVLPIANLNDWADLIQDLDTIDDSIYKYINSVQKIDQINQKDSLEDENTKILQLSRNLKRNNIFDKEDVDWNIKLLLDHKYNVDVLLEISELILNSNYNKKVDNIYGFILESIKNKDKYYRNQIKTKQDISFIKSKQMKEPEIEFSFAIDKREIIDCEDTDVLDDCF